MNEIIWKRRLESIATLVDGSSRGVADIGYDHGYLLELLCSQQRFDRLIGVEIQPGANRRAQATLPPNVHQQLDLRHGNGLEPLSPKEVDTVVVAGVGELKILEIIDAQPDVADSLERLVVCPANFKGMIRLGMSSRGWRCVDEALAFERGHYYPIMAYERGEERLDGPLDYFGPHLSRTAPRHLETYLKHLETRFRSALGAGVGASTGDAFRDQCRRDFICTIEKIGPALSSLKSLA